MTDLTLMTFASDPATVLPSLALLSHRVRVLPMDAASLVKMPENTILFLDARDDLATAMEARCYRAGEGRTKMHQLAYTSRDRLAFITVFLVTAVLLAMYFYFRT